MWQEGNRIKFQYRDHAPKKNRTASPGKNKTEAGWVILQKSATMISNTYVI